MKKATIIIPTNKRSSHVEVPVQKIGDYFRSMSIDFEMRFLPTLLIDFINRECIDNYLSPESVIHISDNNRCYSAEEYLNDNKKVNDLYMTIIESSMYNIIITDLKHSGTIKDHDLLYSAV